MTGGQARLAAAVSAAYTALTGYQERAGEVVWPSPSRGAVEAMVRAQFARAEAAEARLAQVRSVLEGGQPDSLARRRALAVIGGDAP